MAIINYLLPALAVASTAAASCSFTSTTTIVNPAGASALATCTTVTGDIAIQSGAAAGSNAVSLDGIQKIDGALSYQNDDSVNTFSAQQLTSVGDLSFGNLSNMATVMMPALTSVGNMNFSVVGLSSLGFGTPGLAKALNILITDTKLTALNGISNMSSVTGISISNNIYLPTIEFSFVKVTSMDIGSNSQQNGGQTINLPKLETADQLTFRAASSVSLPSLANISQNLGFYDNTFQTMGTPKLTFAGGIVFDSNPNLGNITMPLLTTINGTNGTYQISNNTNLKGIDGFENLTNVNGGLDFQGAFTSVTLPQLNNVGGAMNVTTTGNIDCGPITQFGNKLIVKGQVVCTGATQSTVTSNGTTTTSTGSSPAASSTTGAATPMDIPTSFMGGFTLLAGLMQLLL